MNKLILATIFAFILMSFTYIKPDAMDTPKTPLEKYLVFISQLDTVHITNIGLATDKYQTLFKNEPPATCDTAFAVFMAYYDTLDDALNNSLSTDTMRYLNDTDAADKKYAKKTADFEALLNKYGYQFQYSEGTTYIGENWDFLLKNFSAYISSSMQQYISKLNREAKEGFIEDGAITISPTALAERMIWWDKFISSGSNFIYINGAKELEKNNISAFMLGQPNTPVTDDSGIIDTGFLNAYKYLLAKYPNNRITKIIAPYFRALLKKNEAEKDSILNDYDKKGLIYKNYGD